MFFISESWDEGDKEQVRVARRIDINSAEQGTAPGCASHVPDSGVIKGL